MGSGNKTFDYMEAANLLLKRSYPEIEDGTQNAPIFIPETFLPSYTRGVDPDKFEEKLQQYHDQSNDEFQDVPTNMIDEMRAYKGTFAERLFYDELKQLMEKYNSRAVVLQGSEIISPKLLGKPGSQSGQKQECDFVIVNQDYKYVMSLEIKYNLYAKADAGQKESSIQKGLDQISKIKTLLEAYFCNDIGLTDWKFVGVLGYVNISKCSFWDPCVCTVKCCQECSPFIVRPTELETMFKTLHSTLSKREAIPDLDNDYKLMIRNILYTIFANPGPIVKYKVDDQTFDKIQSQGSCQNVMFWMPEQFNLLHLLEDYKPRHEKVLLTSSFSTGKTEIMKGMMKKLLKRGQKCHFILCNHYNNNSFIA